MFYSTTPYLYKGIVFLVLLNQFVVFLYQITKIYLFSPDFSVTRGKRATQHLEPFE